MDLSKVKWDETPIDINAVQWDDAPAEQSLMDRIRASFDKRIENARKLQQNPNMTGVERAIGNAGQGMGMVADIPMELVKSGVSAIPDFLKNAVTETQLPFLGGQSLKQVGQSSAPILGGISQGYNALEQAAPRVTNVLDATGNALNLGGTLGMINPAAQGIKGVGAPIQGAATATKNAFFPKPTSEEALRQILQAARGQKNPAIISKNLAAGERALNRLDLKGVNTYNGIRTKLDEAIPALSKSVDDELLKNTKIYTLDDLATKQPVQTLGQGTAAIPQSPIEVNFAKDALTHLEELYTKIGEKGKAADIKNTLTRAEWDGISKKEVNDIARTYNKEFGDKAFDVKGDPLTSVNAQQYETVRRGLKEVARRDMPPAAAELDGLMSDIYRTKDLISRNEAAVHQLRDQFKQRGLGEKAVDNIIKYADIVTRGTITGILSKLTTRGFGYKLNNWVELEERLTKNLKILEAAGAAKTDTEMAQILRQNLTYNKPTKVTVKNPSKEELIAALQKR
jgi:predicted Fe-Mo cluster-binding NifX family protein